MKADTTTTVLNIVLAGLVILGVVFALLAMNRTREFRQLSVNAAFANNALLRAQGLANDTAAFNATAKSPELSNILFVHPALKGHPQVITMNNDLNSEIAALRAQVFTLLVALIIVSGTVTVYLYRQASIMRKDIDAIKPQAEKIITTFNQNQKLMMNFVNQLVAYGQTHPEFRPVLLKYGIVLPPAGATAPKK